MSATRPQRDVVLVTGYPRLVAKLVTEEVLALAPDRSVKLLVREKFVDDAQAWVKSTAHADRIELLCGDAASIDLGLSGVEWKQLAREVTYIQHHANISYEGLEPKAVRALNEQGAREVLELARAAPRLRRLVHQSSAMVSGDRTGTVRENELERGQAFRTVIEESKFRAERLMQRAAGGLPITIVRPSLIVGHSKTGEIERLDGPYLLVLLILTSPVDLTPPLPARGDAALNLVPVDYVARSCAALMSRPESLGRVFHLVDSQALPARRVFEIVAQIAGRKLAKGFIPVNITRAVLRAPGIERIAKSPRAFVEHLATHVVFDDRGAREILGPLGIECPRFEDYADAMVAHVRERLAARRAQRGDAAAIDIEDPLA